MMRTAIALVLLSTTLSVYAAEFGWSNLWRNADQRGEQLLQRGDAAAAARVFTDPRRKAHAELIAGDYAQAARDFATLDDGDAHYNRGNALAYAGDLEGALRAYDAALRLDPKNRDAQHNRDLVANALKQQPPSPPQKQAGNPSKNGASDKQEGSRQTSPASPQTERGKPDNSHLPGGDSTHEGSGQSAKKDDANPAGQAGERARPAPSQSASSGPNATASQKNGRQPLGTEGTSVAPVADTAEEAKRDAAASLAGTAPGESDGLAHKQGTHPGDALPPTRLNEQQLAQEQWLRSISDDPGGLLRRKFLIEHLMRQREKQR